MLAEELNERGHEIKTAVSNVVGERALRSDLLHNAQVSCGVERLSSFS